MINHGKIGVYRPKQINATTRYSRNEIRCEGKPRCEYVRENCITKVKRF